MPSAACAAESTSGGRKRSVFPPAVVIEQLLAIARSIDERFGGIRLANRKTDHQASTAGFAEHAGMRCGNPAHAGEQQLGDARHVRFQVQCVAHGEVRKGGGAGDGRAAEGGAVIPGLQDVRELLFHQQRTNR